MSYMSITIYNIYSIFIYYCLYCLHHNLFAYIVCWYWLEQGKYLVQTGDSCKSYCSGAPDLTPNKNYLFSC